MTAVQAHRVVENTVRQQEGPAYQDISSLHISAIGIGMANNSQDVEDAASDLALSPHTVRLFRRLFGLQKLPFDRGKPLAGLLRAALADLENQVGQFEVGPTYVVHCHTLPTVKPPDLAFAAGAAEFPESETCSLAMNHCASGVAALGMLDAVLGDDDIGLLLIGERAFHRRIRLIEDTTIMGEAAAAVVVRRGGGLFEILSVCSDHDGAFAVSRGHPGEEMIFGGAYKEFLIAHINRSLERAGVSLDEVTMVLPHNVNTLSWIGVARALKIPIEKIFLENIERFGHCFGADPFINAMDAVRSGRVRPGMPMLMVSVGMGLSAGSALVRPTPQSVDFRQ